MTYFHGAVRTLISRRAAEFHFSSGCLYYSSQRYFLAGASPGASRWLLCRTSGTPSGDFDSSTFSSARLNSAAYAFCSPKKTVLDVRAAHGCPDSKAPQGRAVYVNGLLCKFNIFGRSTARGVWQKVPGDAAPVQPRPGASCGCVNCGKQNESGCF